MIAAALGAVAADYSVQVAAGGAAAKATVGAADEVAATPPPAANTRQPMVTIPEPLAGGEIMEQAILLDVPTPEALAGWLSVKGLDTSAWGKEKGSKTVKKLWQEIEAAEAGLELWKRADGETQPVRVTHVLRAKVTSAAGYERNLFLFNTWQQFPDGRKRTRNGLLSEKLTTAEMPFEKHLEEICRRAVVEEEMQRVAPADLKILPGEAPMEQLEYDPTYRCPLTVEECHFVDHTVELEIEELPRVVDDVSSLHSGHHLRWPSSCRFQHAGIRPPGRAREP